MHVECIFGPQRGSNKLEALRIPRKPAGPRFYSRRRLRGRRGVTGSPAPSRREPSVGRQLPHAARPPGRGCLMIKRKSPKPTRVLQGDNSSHPVLKSEDCNIEAFHQSEAEVPKSLAQERTGLLELCTNEIARDSSLLLPRTAAPRHLTIAEALRPSG